MKKIIIAVLVICSAANTYAQKYMTRTGKVSFHAGTPLEDIDAISNESAAALNSQGGDVVFQIPIKSFKFRRALMQEHFNENYMESDKYPKAEYKAKIMDISNVNFAKDGVYKVKTQGKLTIHNVTNDVTVPGTITVKGDKLTVAAAFKVKTADYKINIPKLVEDKIAKEVEIEVNAIMDKK